MGLDADVLDAVRIADRAGSYWSAVRSAAAGTKDAALRDRFAEFNALLDS